MRAFAYRAAASLDDAAQAAAQAETILLAGGTNVVDLVKIEVMNPAQLLDINGLELRRIEVGPQGATIGALVSNTALAEHAGIKQQYPLLSEAILSGATVQLRNMATVGGNLLQRTRCSYFRDLAMPCNKRDPGSGCGAMDGFNRMNAVLGTSDKCIAAHPSDMCVALAALEAVILVRGRGGERAIPFADFHLEPGQHPEREFALQPGELIVGVTLPPPPPALRARYVKVRDRASYAFALASAAAGLQIEGGRIRTARLALGGVGTKPWRRPEAEAALVGQAPGRDAFDRAARIALQGAQPRKHNAFKTELARRTAVRAFLLAAEGA